MAQETNSVSVWTEFFQGDASGTLAGVALVVALAMVCITLTVITLRRPK